MTTKPNKNISIEAQVEYWALHKRYQRLKHELAPTPRLIAMKAEYYEIVTRMGNLKRLMGVQL